MDHAGDDIKCLFSSPSINDVASLCSNNANCLAFNYNSKIMAGCIKSITFPLSSPSRICFYTKSMAPSFHFALLTW